ncbi:hypothetical protein KXS07_36440, partial [Inquilinus limosus]|uniref:calcium-binding protein n=1 Tax=Inquilinus limosus TaxID=171674 RepID=UPI003F191C61
MAPHTGTIMLVHPLAVDLSALLYGDADNGRRDGLAGRDASQPADDDAADRGPDLSLDVPDRDGASLPDSVNGGKALNSLGTIEGDDDVDLIYGKLGDDEIYGKGGDDWLWGGRGDDRLSGGDGNDRLWGEDDDDDLFGDAGDDILEGGQGADRLDGGAGEDTASYAESAAGVVVDLASGMGRGGDAEGDTLVEIENVIGSAYNDVFVASAEANWIGGEGGVDRVDYSLSTAGVTVDLGTGRCSGGWAEGDFLFWIEEVLGSAYNDRITGGVTANRLSGGAGDDFLYGVDGDDVLDGGAGVDVLDGGAGADTVSYLSSAAGVTVDLAAGVGAGGDAAGDSYRGIENVEGSAHDDTIVAGAAANRLDGGKGLDTVSYAGSDAGVFVDLAAGTGTHGWAEGDVLVGIENLVGSAHADTLNGNGGANRLAGGAGGDTLRGQGGDDVLLGGTGVDWLDGGAGVDLADYSGSTGGVTVDLPGGTGAGGDAEGDVLIGIEEVAGSAYSDRLTGDGAANRLFGGAGCDRLDGGGGQDQLYGEDGDDQIDGGSGEDWLYGENGADVITGGGDIDQISGGAGDDVVSGDGHDDALYGDAGADRLEGGEGRDRL